MGANIPSWTKAYYGKTLTPQQYLNNSAAQEAVARGKLQSYYNKYGARGAASAWYSGNASLSESTRSQSGGPSIKSYVDSVMNHAAGFPSEGGGSNYKSGAAPVPKLSSSELAEQYGFVSSFLNSNSELKKLFQQAVSGGWTADKFQAKIRNTKWWKSHPKEERDYLTQRFTDPATAKQSLSEAEIKVKQMANALGIIESPFTLKKIKEAAYNMVAKGWDEGQIRYNLGQYVYFTKGKHQGEGGELYDQLEAYAYNMGVKTSDSWMGDRIRRAVRGTATIQDFKNELNIIAKAQFPQWSKQIDGGQTVADMAQPYMQSMSQILELPAGSINLFDPNVKKAMSWTDPSTNKKGAKPLWQYENDLRNDSRWKQTKNAQDSLMQVAHQVLADFGLKH
jgi:hypothetical protein